jgi:hypothetical protein
MERGRGGPEAAPRPFLSPRSCKKEGFIPRSIKEIVFNNPYQLQIGGDGGIHFGNDFEHFKYDPQGRLVLRDGH